MLDVVIDTLIDALKLLPFLFVTFLLMEYIEHKTSGQSKKIVEKAGKFGPIIGSFLGAFPQCGFSVAATNLYATRVITLGTLIAIYLSTSDEMLPILLSQQVDITLIILILLIKVVTGILFGIIIDAVIKRKGNKSEIEDFCHDEHCDCEHGILKSAMKHTVNILLFLMVISFVLNLGFAYLGEEKISQLFLKDSFFGPFLTSLIGFIPNCGASVIITELYLKGAITLGATLSGLLTGTGIALLVLFKVNKDLLENMKILFILYLIGVIVGLIVDTFVIIL